MKKLCIAAIIVSVSLMATTVSAADAGADAKVNYEKNCAGCHGKDGKGDTKLGQKMEIRDYTDAKVQDKLKDEEMFKSIKEGLKKADKTLMKPYADKFSDAEIKGLVAFVRSLKKK